MKKYLFLLAWFVFKTGSPEDLAKFMTKFQKEAVRESRIHDYHEPYLFVTADHIGMPQFYYFYEADKEIKQ